MGNSTESSPNGQPVGAAFFDLDRTLLRGASGEVFSEAMRAAGLVSRTIPGEKYIFNLFNTIGETLPSMALARQAVTFAKGRSQSAVRAAADAVADQLVDMVQPFADGVFEGHRVAGRPIVLATTSPYDLVKPFADRLGLDGVVATRYGVEPDGDTYDGSLAGPFVWSAGKLEAVRSWARETRHRPAPELRLLRQRVRHALAGGGRPRCRRQPGSPDADHGSGSRMAGSEPRRVAGRQEGAGDRSRAAEGGDGLLASVDAAIRRLRHPRH